MKKITELDQKVRFEGGVEVDLADIFEISSDWFWVTDDQLRYVYLSPHFEAVTGELAAWYYGKTRRELGMAPEGATDPIERREPYSGLVISRQTRDGRRIWIRSSGRPIFGADGAFRGFIGTGADITEQIEAQRGIEYQHHLFIESMQSMSDGLAMFGADGKLVFCNDSFERLNPNLAPDIRVGMSFEDMVRLNLSHGRILEAVGREDRYLAERMAQFDNADGEPRISRRNDGRTLMVIVKRLHDGSTFLINRDLTDIKEHEASLESARREAETANRAKSAFLASMSHELRTPLNAIIGFSEMLKMNAFGGLGGSKNQEYVEDNHTTALHLLNLIDDVLDLSMIEAGKQNVDRAETDIGAVIGVALEMTARDAGEKGVRLEVQIPEGLPVLRVDRRHLTQILVNLIANAIKYTPRGGRVDVAVEAEPRALAISVRDDGPGIPADQIPRMLEKFERADDVITRNERGTGLGLPLANSLTELNGGDFALTSDVGKGTTAVVRFPI
ncbi:MAG: ATP-binding protein [Rhodospirillaceae bacterium]